jgi:acylpyruvate hydrolase
MTTTIQNIWAVGRNYSEHAEELNNPVPESNEDPMIFLKAGSCVVENEKTFSLPDFTADIHHECEIAFRFGAGLKLTEMTLALDLTAREVQAKLKEKQHPWTLAKSFKAACPIGPLVRIPNDLDLENIAFSFAVNGEIRQSGNSKDMINSVHKLREYVLSRFPVAEGDLLLTGTPKGVGLLRKGDRLAAEIAGLLRASWDIAK